MAHRLSDGPNMQAEAPHIWLPELMQSCAPLPDIYPVAHRCAPLPGVSSVCRSAGNLPAVCEANDRMRQQTIQPGTLSEACRVCLRQIAFVPNAGAG